jgi:ribosomal protein S4
LKYFNLINTARDYYVLKKFLPYNTKLSRLPALSYLEFQLANVLVRSNFFENGYIANSLIRRGVFLVNGGVVSSPISLQV